MKTFMLRRKPVNKHCVINNHLPKSFKYGVWYALVTPFDTQYFKLKKGSRYIHIYDFIGSPKPEYTVTKQVFIHEFLIWSKARPYEVDKSEYEWD